MYLDDYQTALYRLYDADGGLLYVGITCHPERRWTSHRSDKPWWPNVASKVIEWYETRPQALAAELEAIRTELPLYNRAGSPLTPGPRELEENEILQGQAKELLRGIELGARIDAPVFVVDRCKVRRRTAVLVSMDFYERALEALGEDRVPPDPLS